MITGVVRAGDEAVVRIQIRAPGRRVESVEAVVDTGFTGYLALPHNTIDDLRLPYRGSQRVALADGSEVSVPIYRGLVEWHGSARSVVVLGVEGGALLGMSLLRGSRLSMVVRPGGDVQVEAIS